MDVEHSHGTSRWLAVPSRLWNGALLGTRENKAPSIFPWGWLLLPRRTHRQLCRAGLLVLSPVLCLLNAQSVSQGSELRLDKYIKNLGDIRFRMTIFANSETSAKCASPIPVYKKYTSIPVQHRFDVFKCHFSLSYWATISQFHFKQSHI